MPWRRRRPRPRLRKPRRRSSRTKSGRGLSCGSFSGSAARPFLTDFTRAAAKVNLRFPPPADYNTGSQAGPRNGFPSAHRLRLGWSVLTAGHLVPVSFPSSETATARRRIVVLGSTGSIGTNCLDVIRALNQRLEAVGLSAHESWQTLFEQANQVRPRWVTVTDADVASVVDRSRLPAKTELLFGRDGIIKMVTDPDVDVV